MRLESVKSTTPPRKKTTMPKRKSPLTRFLETHKKPLTLVSAVIVFLSFTFKEALGERAKEKLQEIKDAETEYQRAMSERFSMDRSFSDIEENLTLLTEVLVKGQKKTPDEEELDRAAKSESLQVSDFYLVYNRIKALAEHSDRKTYYLTAIDKLTQEEDVASREPYIADPTKEQKLKRMATSTEIWRDEYRKIKKIEHELSSEITTKQHRLEIMLKVTSWGTYILFVFGWGLGLILSLEGVEAPNTV
jgi:hypothetical protein